MQFHAHLRSTYLVLTIHLAPVAFEAYHQETDYERTEYLCVSMLYAISPRVRADYQSRRAGLSCLLGLFFELSNMLHEIILSIQLRSKVILPVC